MVESVIDGLSRDYLLIRLLKEEQVQALSKEFSDISDKIRDELCLLLEGYGEISADNTPAEKLIRSVIETSCDQIHKSNALILFKAFLRHQLKEKNRLMERLYNRDDNSLKNITNFIKSKDSDLLSIFDSGLRSPVFILCRDSILPWMPTHDRRTFMDHLYLGLNGRSVKISISKLLQFCLTSHEKNLVCSTLGSPHSEKVGITINYFSEDIYRKILEELMGDSDSRAAIAGEVAWAISEYIKDDSESIVKTTGKKSNISVFGLEQPKNINQSDLTRIADIYRRRACEFYIKKSAEKVYSCMPKQDFSAWDELTESFENFVESLRLLSEKSACLNNYAGDVSNQIKDQIYEFLVEHDLNPLTIPTITELGKKKGGYALVKAISAQGGLKAIRADYVRWAMKKLNEATNNTIESVFEQENPDLITDKWLRDKEYGEWKMQSMKRMKAKQYEKQLLDKSKKRSL